MPAGPLHDQLLDNGAKAIPSSFPGAPAPGARAFAGGHARARAVWHLGKGAQAANGTRRMLPVCCRYTQSGQKTAVVDPYVEVRAGAEVFRTPCVHASPAPAWNWDFDLRLPAPLGTQGAVNSLKCVGSTRCCACVAGRMAPCCCDSGQHDTSQFSVECGDISGGRLPAAEDQL